MAKKDWEEIQHKLEAATPKLLEKLIDSDEPFFLSVTFKTRLQTEVKTFQPNNLN